MLKKLIRKSLETAANTYIKRIEVKGRTNLPKVGIYAGNHPSGLVDPMVIMTALPHIDFCSVAKSSLFTSPVVSFFVKTMEAIPVAKPAGTDANSTTILSQSETKAINSNMFFIAQQRLENNTSIIIFPEGTCHDQPSIKELKIGTAKIALEIAANSNSSVRIPIIPTGLSYSSPSGLQFRGKVLVDFGRPVHITDRTLALYKAGDKEAKYKICQQITDRIETAIRDVTIKTPQWNHLLILYCLENNLPPPPENLSIVESRKSYFDLTGAKTFASSEFHDREFVNHLHLARRIYRPSAVPLSLAQYASLTRNFLKISIKRAHTPEFQKIWKLLVAYKSELDELEVRDSYIELHKKNSDPLNERLKNLREKAGAKIAKLIFFAPLSLFGTAIHFPMGYLSYKLGNALGTADEDGDTSVVATMRMISGLVSLTLAYPILGVATSFTLNTSAAFLPTQLLLASSAYAALKYPITDVLTSARGSFRLLTKRDNIDTMRDKRATLQGLIREFADKNATNKDMVGWWKDPERYVSRMKVDLLAERIVEAEKLRRVTQVDFEKAEMTEMSIELVRNKRVEGERAVLTYKQNLTNDRAIVWLPGRNDSFFHVHVLQQLLDAGYDVFALDLRRCGRAKVDEHGEKVVVDLLAHDSNNFREYFEELDATFKFLKTPKMCGKDYSKIVLFSHSTGSLIAALYGQEGGWRGSIDGFIFNSPFWMWNLKRIEKAVVENW